MDTNIFERASRNKIRFETLIGDLTTEQLWDLHLTARGDRPDLDKIAISLHMELKGLDEVSFVNLTPHPRKAELELKLEIVKRVIEVKVESAKAAEKRAENAERRKRILDILAKKDDETLANKPREELMQELAALGE
jgi:hypothetical protein